jgi:hypothetical protein
VSEQVARQSGYHRCQQWYPGLKDGQCFHV